MSCKLSVAGQVAKELCERFPSAKTNTLARKAFNENPGLYKSVEEARSFIRRRRGESGDALRRQCILTPTTKHVRLPKSDALPKRDYRFFENGFGAILSDIHIPYHSERALEIAIDHCREEGATDFVILNGDTVDCYQLSRWVREPRKRNFRGEIDKTNQLLDFLQSIFGKIIFKLGNHEVRFYDYLRSQAPVLLDIEALTWEDLLKFKERGIDIVADGQAIVTPNLHIVHGHEWGGMMTNPVNPARGLFMRAKASTVCGHFHQTSDHTEGTLDGKLISTYSLGCLCDLKPEYRPMADSKWNHGFATLRLSGNEYHIGNRRIVRGRVY